MATKTSIILFFLSLSKEEKVFRWCNYLVLFVVNAAGLAVTIVSIFQCRPITTLFRYPISADAKCFDIVALYLSSAPVNIITDLSLLFLPMPIMTRMRLPKKQKRILVVTFSFGIFVAVVDVVRIVYLQGAELARVEDSHRLSLTNSRIREDNDFSWYASLSFMWSAVEVNVGIMVACVPSLKPLCQRFFPSWIRDSNEKTEIIGTSDSNASNNETSIAPQADASAPVPTTELLRNPAAILRRPSQAESHHTDESMGFADFLAMADEDAPMSLTATNTTTYRKPTFFDFVNMKHPKNMLRLSNRESFMPVAVVTFLFFILGFAYGFLNILDGQFEIIAELPQNQTLGLHAAYYSGYFIGPLTLGQFILKKYGFKATLITGMVVYACGTLIFWPSAVLTSYTAFVLSNVIVGTGLSIVEIASNPFILLCGPLEYAEIRLNLSQGVQAIGTVVSPLIAKKYLFKDVLDAPSLINVQWTYLAIALFDVLVAVFLYYLPLPEAADEDLEDVATRRQSVHNAKIWNRFPVFWVTLVLGVFSQWCYVGGQESIGTNTQALFNTLKPNGTLRPFDYLTIAHTIFAAGRFFTAMLNFIFMPRWILLGLYTGLIITTALTLSLKGDASVAMLLLVYLFESGVFILVFGITIRGMGRHTKTASALITAAISGGSPFPPIQNAVANRYGIRYSFCVTTALFAFGAIFPIYLNVFPQAKKQVDPVHEFRPSQRRRDALISTLSEEPDSNVHKFGIKGIVARHHRHVVYERKKKRYQSSNEVSSRHIERSSQVNSSCSQELGGTTVSGPTHQDNSHDDFNIDILGLGPLENDPHFHVEKGRERQLSSVFHDHAYGSPPSPAVRSLNSPTCAQENIVRQDMDDSNSDSIALRNTASKNKTGSE